MWNEKTAVGSTPSEVYTGERRHNGVILVNSGSVPVWINDVELVSVAAGVRLDPGVLFTWPSPRNDSEVTLWAVTEADPGELEVLAPGY